MIYKILTAHEWEQTQRKGRFDGSSVDHRDGFIHFSSASQVRETAAKHFAGQDNLVLLGIDETAFGPELKWEVSRNQESFPHLYATFDVEQVSTIAILRLDEHNQHTFPNQL